MPSKELIKNLFRLKGLPRTPFIPWISSFAAQTEQISVEEMFSDPGLLATSLLNTQELFGYDAIAIGFDSSLEAEACGCEIEWPDEAGELPRVVSHPLSEGASAESIHAEDIEKRGRIPVCLDALKRINIMRGKQVGILGVVTGPFTLARHLQGPEFPDKIKRGSNDAVRAIAVAGSIGLRLSRKYCESGIDVIVLADEILGSTDFEAIKHASGPLKSIWNVTRFFDVPSLILTTACRIENVNPILGLGAGGISLGTKVGVDCYKEALAHDSCFGRSIALTPPITNEDIKQTDKPPKGYFLTTDWEVPYKMDIEKMHEVMQTVL